MALRMTVQTRVVLRTFLREPARELYGRELSDQAGLMPGTVHPILCRLENAGWLSSRKEDIDPHAEKRPARRYYRLTAKGATQASNILTGSHGSAVQERMTRCHDTCEFLREHHDVLRRALIVAQAQAAEERYATTLAALDAHMGAPP